MSIPKQSNNPKATQKTLDEQKAEQTTQERKVRFHGRVRRRYVDAIPIEEHDNVWYTATDIADARKRERVLRECVSVDKEVYRRNQENLNAQGVLTEEQASDRDTIIDASLSAVLDEQDRQESEFYACNKFGKVSLDTEAIAQSYRTHSQASMEKAHARATRHEKHVQEIATQVFQPMSPFSPYRILKNIPTQQSHKRLARSQIPRPSVFVAEGSSSSSKEVIRTTPAA